MFAGYLLLVEDEPGLVKTLTDRLAAEGYGIESVADVAGALDLAVRRSFDAIILDVMLHDGSGLDVCRAVRAGGLPTPILILTARGEVRDRVAGLKLGADDYLVKPFEMMELLARIEALLRRRVPARPPELFRAGDVTIDFERSEIRRGTVAVGLSARERRLLRYLFERQSHTVSREELLEQVWGYDTMAATRTVDVHVAWLRQKLGDDPRHPRFIITVHGHGYKFIAPL